MISYEEAKERALAVKPTANVVTECKDAWIFAEEFSLISPAVVLKDSGEVINFLWFTDEMHGDTTPLSETHKI